MVVRVKPIWLLSCLVAALVVAPVWASPGAASNALTVASSDTGVTLSWKGVPFHETERAVLDTRLVDVPGSATRIALWTEESADGNQQPFYAISLDGEKVNLTHSTSYDLELQSGSFDPVQGEPAVPVALQADALNEVYMVQFVTQPLEVFQDQLESLGAHGLFFLPYNALLVQMTPEVRDAVAQLPYVRHVGPYHPAYKLDVSILDEIASAGPVGTEVREFSVMAFGRGPANQQKIAERIIGMGGEVINTCPEGFRMTVRMTLPQTVEIAYLNETHFIDPWGPGGPDMDIVRQIGGAVPTLSNAGFTGQGVRGEIFDTEVDGDHPEWNGQTPLYHSPDGNAGTHGSSCYGICFSTGVVQANATGLCPDREQGIFCFYDNTTQFGGSYTRHALNQEATDPNGIYRSVFQTSSVGGDRTLSYTTISAETDDYLFLYDYLSCQSQSNATNSQMSRPQAWAKNIVSVGGITHHDTLTRSDDDYSSGSMGPAADGRTKPDLAHFYDDTYTTTSNAGYTQFGGTSGATPCTAGHFGLLMQMWHEGVFPDHGGGATVFDSRPKSTTAKAMMINHAYRYTWYGTGAPNPELNRDRQGWGMADVGSLYNSANNMSIFDESEVIQPLESRDFVAVVAPGEPELRATMVYIDPQGNPAASVHRINNLSLKMTSPSGVVYWGNDGLHTSNWSAPNGTENNIDTVENIFLQAPEAGVWSVSVIGTEIVQDSHLETPELDADFALVVTGAFVAQCTSEGRISLNKGTYACEDVATIRVVDCDLNLDDNVIDTATATIESDTEPFGETVVLTETAANTADFRGDIAISATNAVGVLQVGPGDAVTATYIDADDGNGNYNVVVQDSALVDCSPPIISNVQTINIEPRNATVTFNTTEEATATVYYGTSCGALNDVVSSGGYETSHTLTINGLQDNTTYYYAVEAIDHAGNVTYDDNAGGCYWFTTPEHSGLLHRAVHFRLGH